MSDQEIHTGRVVPRVLEFYTEYDRPEADGDEPVDQQAVSVGWETTHWGLWFPGGVVTIAVDGQAVQRWHSIEDACEELDAFVAEVNPQRLRSDTGGSVTSPAGDGGQAG